MDLARFRSLNNRLKPAVPLCLNSTNMWVTFAICAVLLLVTTSCATIQPKSQNFWQHVIAFDANGDPINPKTQKSFERRHAYRNDELFHDHIKPIVHKIANRVSEGKPKVILYFHGALNRRAAALNNSIQHYNCFDDEFQSDFYPVFVNWDSSIWSAYWHHLVKVRQGRRTLSWGIPTAPFYLFRDVGRGVAKAPLTWGYQIKKQVSANTGIGAFQKNADDIHRKASEHFWRNSAVSTESAGNRPAIPISRWNPRSEKPTHTANWISRATITLPFQLISSPFITAVGTPAWTHFQRRTRNAIRRPSEFDTRLRTSAFWLDSEPTGTLAMFISALNKKLDCAPPEDTDCIEFTLIGHSAGAIVVNRLIEAFPQNDFRTIVYLGSASTIDDFATTVIPYLMANPQSKFYNVTLDTYAEARETSVGGIAPMGSLLEWLDTYFTLPPNHMGRIMGKWENMMDALHVVPERIRSRVTMKKLPAGDATYPQKHGQFNNRDFKHFNMWDSASWQVERTNSKVEYPCCKRTTKTDVQCMDLE